MAQSQRNSLPIGSMIPGLKATRRALGRLTWRVSIEWETLRRGIGRTTSGSYVIGLAVAAAFPRRSLSAKRQFIRGSCQGSGRVGGLDRGEGGSSAAPPVGGRRATNGLGLPAGQTFIHGFEPNSNGLRGSSPPRRIARTPRLRHIAVRAPALDAIMLR